MAQSGNKGAFRLEDDPRYKRLPPVRDEMPERKVSSVRSSKQRSRFGVRTSIKGMLHWTIYTILHLIFGIYLRLRKTCNTVTYRLSSALFYHHRTPELIQRDTAHLRKKPTHVSVILTIDDESRAGAELERLVDEVAEIAAWTACAGIPMLSVYEKTGILKKYLPHVHQNVAQRLGSYFGNNRPSLVTVAPHQDELESSGSALETLKLFLVSSQDGRESLVDLTKTLADMSQRGKLSINDIQSDLIGTELSEGIFPEPELLVVFTPTIRLAGYPPWHLRTTEIFCLQDNDNVGYQVFLRALCKYGKAEIRQGK